MNWPSNYTTTKSVDWFGCCIVAWPVHSSLCRWRLPASKVYHELQGKGRKWIRQVSLFSHRLYVLTNMRNWECDVVTFIQNILQHLWVSTCPTSSNCNFVFDIKSLAPSLHLSEALHVHGHIIGHVVTAVLPGVRWRKLKCCWLWTMALLTLITSGVSVEALDLSSTLQTRCAWTTYFCVH